MSWPVRVEADPQPAALIKHEQKINICFVSPLGIWLLQQKLTNTRFEHKSDWLENLSGNYVKKNPAPGVMFNLTNLRTYVLGLKLLRFSPPSSLLHSTLWHFVWTSDLILQIASLALTLQCFWFPLPDLSFLLLKSLITVLLFTFQNTLQFIYECRLDVSPIEF